MRTVRWATGLTLLLVVVTVFFVMSQHHGLLASNVVGEWHIWLVLTQAASMSVLLWRLGLPSTWRGKGMLLFDNILLLVVAALVMQHLLAYTFIRFLELCLRIAVVGAWSIAVGGFPFVLRWIVRRKRGVRESSLLAKLWFSCVLALSIAEPVSWTYEWKQRQLALPPLETLPPAGEIHVVALGDSTMVGWPYAPKFGMPTVVEWQLKQMYPDRKVVVQNLAYPGINLKEAVERLKLLEYRPHHLILYSGHNEFYHDVEELSLSSPSLTPWLDRGLERSPTFRLASQTLSEHSALIELSTGARRLLIDHPAAQPNIYARRLERFKSTLRQLARHCSDRQITMQWYIPAGSERGYEPNRTCVVTALSAGEEQHLNAQYNTIRALEDEKKWSEAAAACRDVLKTRPELAEFHYRLAECLYEQQKWGEARVHYESARDQDGHPVSANADYRNAVKDVAAAFSIPTIDAYQVLRPHAPHGIIDGTLIHDNVHPTLKAFHLLGMAATEQLRAEWLLEARFGSPRQAARTTLAEATRDAGLTAADVAEAYRITAADWWQLRLLRFDESRREELSAHYRRLSEQLASGALKPGEAGTEPLE